MPADHDLAALLDDALAPDARAALEEALAADADGLRALLAQERLDAVLRVVLGSAAAHERVKRAIMAELDSGDTGGAKARLLAAIHDAPRPRPAKPWWLLALIAFAAAAAFILLNKRPETVPHDDNAAALDSHVLAELDAGPPDVMPAQRFAPLWPFAADSPWNTSIGAGARYEATEPATPGDCEAVFIFRRLALIRATDPLRTFELPGGHTETARLDDRIVGGARRPLVLMNLREQLAVEVFAMWRPDATRVTAEGFARTDLRSSGIGGVGFSEFGGSTLGGIIRAGEFERGIFHALAVQIPADRLAGSTWPAAKTDAPFSARGNLRIGTLLALPPDAKLTDFAAPGTATFRLARALQDYGAYVTGTADAGRVVFSLDNRESQPPLPRELLARLRVVANNAPDNIGGGGARRQPPAPAFR